MFAVCLQKQIFKMQLITVFFFLIGCMLQFGSTKECTGNDLGAVVPASICDNSKCQSLSTEDLAMISNEDVKLYTWNIANKYLSGLCGTRLIYTLSPNLDKGKLTGNLTFAVRLGTQCNETYNYTLGFTTVPDPKTTECTVFTAEDAGEVWEICHPFYIPNGPFVYRACRTTPPPQDGTGFASIFVLEPASGNCQRDAVIEFLKGYDAKWEQNSITCDDGGEKQDKEDEDDKDEEDMH